MPTTLDLLLQKHQTRPCRESAFALGQMFEQMREYGRAAEYFVISKDFHPESANSWIRCGDALAQAGRLQQAVEHYQHALRLAQGDADTHFRVASAYAELDLPEPATEHLVRSLMLNPQQARPWEMLAQLHGNESGLETVVESMRSLVSGQVDHDSFFSGMAWGLSMVGRYDDARTLLLRQVRSRPYDTELLMRLAEVEDCRGNMPAAGKVHERALEVVVPAARHLVFTSYLHHLVRTGDLEAARRVGRRRTRTRSGYQMSAPGWEQNHYQEWSGEPLVGKTVLMPLWRTGIGHGDALQSARFAVPLKKMGATVIVECHRTLESLLSTLDGADLVQTPFRELPPIDYCVHAGIACLLAEDWSDTRFPYVHPSANAVAAWQAQLGNRERLKVGINWSGTQLWRRDKNRYRSIPLAELALLAALPGIEIFSLQFGPESREAAEVSFPIRNLPVGDFLDTAAAVQALDAVVTVDSAMAHLAAALGKPCLVLLPYVSEWRWMLGRTDTPLYPSIYLCRQKEPGEWRDAVTEAMARLADIFQEQQKRLEMVAP